tara:strand:- start:115 stop:1218 length:1104 start_codon:yes stop_codon:yes gene_type:complete
MVRPPYILADFPVDDPLSEYFTRKNIEFDSLPEELSVPIVDQIHHMIEGKENVILILGVLKLRRLFDENSIYHDFREMINTGIKIVLYNHMDCMFDLMKLCNIDTEESLNFTSWLNELKPNVLTDGIAGKWFKENYNKCEFIELQDPFLGHAKNFPELSSRKRHDPKKDFLCLMTKGPRRSHRDLLHKQMTAKGLIEHTIYKFEPRSLETHNDLKESFSEITTKGITWPDGIPPVHYYNQTNLEIVAETYGHYNHDDTFVITEKTTKPITMKHPFMVLSSFHFLRNLRALGFRTFRDHLDESYDLEKDVKKRIEIITNNLVMLKGSGRKLYNDTQEIRDHNLLNLQHQAGMYKTKLWNRMDEFMKNI